MKYGNNTGLAHNTLTDAAVLDMTLKGMTPRQMAQATGFSYVTMKDRITRLQADQNIILEYRKLQNIHLTQKKYKLLEAMTDEKIEFATLGEIAQTYKILHTAECAEIGKPSEITGLMGYLLKLEEEESALKSTIPDAPVINVAPDYDTVAEMREEEMPVEPTGIE